MKKTFNILIIFVTICMFGVSCHSDLDVSQKGIVANNDAWKEPADAVSHMYGMMSTFRAAFATDYMYWGEYRTGLWGKGNETQPAREDAYNNTISAGHAQADWTALYTTLNHANLILKHVPEISFNNESDKNRILGSAHFVRAFCYYWIGRIWGDAPVLTKGFESDRDEGLFPTRDKSDMVFQQVLDDITQAEGYFANINGITPNMPSLAAVLTLKTDYYLWMAKVRGDASALTEARTTCDRALAVASAEKELLTSYADIFNTKNNKEVIFVWSMIKDEKEGGFQADWLCALQYVSAKYIESPVKVGSHQQWAAFTAQYKAIIDEVATDQRSRVSYDYFFDPEKNTTHHWINKFSGTWASGARTFDSDIIVYRMADLIMFDAEIKNDQNQKDGAIDALNKITKRAYGVDNYYPKTLTKDEVTEKIIHERKKEFSAEGKLWWDYIRFGVAFKEVPSLVGRENERNLLLWPISLTSINKNPALEQTDFTID